MPRTHRRSAPPAHNDESLSSHCLPFEAAPSGPNATAAFMAGPFLLVAPVVDAAAARAAVYLPRLADAVGGAATAAAAAVGDGTWVDWWNGTRYAGGATLTQVGLARRDLPWRICGLGV